MENKFPAMIIEKLRPAKDVEELIVIAKENGVELDREAAKQFFDEMAELTDEELTDEELAKIAAGRCPSFMCPICGCLIPSNGDHDCE